MSSSPRAASSSEGRGEGREGRIVGSPATIRRPRVCVGFANSTNYGQAAELIVILLRCDQFGIVIDMLTTGKLVHWVVRRGLASLLLDWAVFLDCSV